MTPEQMESICSRIAEGETLRAICKDLGLKRSTVSDHLIKNAEMFGHSTRARELGCDALADQCIEIADDTTIDPANKRVMIETRIRLIGKWSQRYSDKLAITKTTEVTHRYDLDNLSSGELNELERILANARPSKGGEGEEVAARLH